MPYVLPKRLLPLLPLPLLLAGAAGAKSDLKALSSLEPGQWQISQTGSDHGINRKVCLPNDAALIQVEHPGERCKRLVIEDSAKKATVHYSCPGKGDGRTRIRIETPRQARIDTRGVAGGMPFQIRLDAKKIGDCSSR